MALYLQSLSLQKNQVSPWSLPIFSCSVDVEINHHFTGRKWNNSTFVI